MDRIQTHRDSGTSSSSQAVLIFYTKVYTKVDSAHLVRATPWLHGGMNEWTLGMERDTNTKHYNYQLI